jgi:hypothetical protein
MKVSNHCVFCKEILFKAKKFPNIDHDNSYEMWCDCCPTYQIKWGVRAMADSTTNTYAITYATEECKPEDIYGIFFHIDDIIIEMYPSDKRPHGDAFRIFKVNYDPVYKSKFVMGLPFIPKIDFENLTPEYLKNKINKYILFI